VYGAVKQERSLEKGKTAKLSSKSISLYTLYVRWGWSWASTAESANQICTAEKQVKHPLIRVKCLK